MNRTPDRQMLKRLETLSGQPLDDWLEAINRDAVPYRRWLYRVCQEYDIGIALELGVNTARTTCLLAAGVSQMAIGVEITPDRNTIDASIATLPEEHRDKLAIVKGDSLDRFTQARVVHLLAGQPVELLFIDSLHRAEQARQEWEIYGPMLAPTALVVMDDCKDPPEMEEVFWSLPGVQVELDALHMVSGRYEMRGTTVGFGAVIICH